MRVLLLLFIALPIAEIFVLIQVGSVIGAFSTVALVVLTAVVGVILLRKQGQSAITRAQQKLQAGGVPAEEMVEGLFLAVGGALLLTPGFITDTVGFCCLIPGVRKGLLLWAIKHLYPRMTVNVRSAANGDHFQQVNNQPDNKRNQSNSGQTIEGDYRRED